MDYQKVVRNYAIDINENLHVSPFECIETFTIRDFIANNMESFSENEVNQIKSSDRILLNQAEQYYDHLNPTKIWGNNMSLRFWWWHLDKIVADSMKIDIDSGFGVYRGNEFSIY